MNPDPAIAAALEYQLARLLPIQRRIEVHAAHPPAIGSRDWAGAAATAHESRLTELRRLLRLAHDAVVVATELTRRELVRAGG